MKCIAGLKIMLNFNTVSNHHKEEISLFHCDTLPTPLFKMCLSGTWLTGILIKTHLYGSSLPASSK